MKKIAILLLLVMVTGCKNNSTNTSDSYSDEAIIKYCNSIDWDDSKAKSVGQFFNEYDEDFYCENYLRLRPLPTLPKAIKPTSEPKTTNKYSCSTSKNCGDMKSCEEAYYYLNTCGKSSLDRDKDGIPCETFCN